MKAIEKNTNTVDSYYTLLKSLSPNNKLELIARLSKSMKSTKIKKDTSWEDLFGAWELDETSDKFIEDLVNDRNFTRKSIEL
jgi:hypothetical protein